MHKSDSSALQGTWKGQEAIGGAEGSCSLVISGYALEYHGADVNDWCKGTFMLREDTNPKQLVGVISECPDPQYVGKAVCSIYKIEAGTLTIAGNHPGNPEVPASFDAPGARKLVLKNEQR